MPPKSSAAADKKASKAKVGKTTLIMQGSSGKAAFFKWCQRPAPAAEKSHAGKKGSSRTTNSNSNQAEVESDEACTSLVGIPGVRSRLEKLHSEGTLAKLIPANVLKTLLPVSSPAMTGFLQRPTALALRLRSYILEPFCPEGTH
jgi:hypothetical protein